MKKLNILLFYCGKLMSHFVCLSVITTCISCGGQKTNDISSANDSVMAETIAIKNEQGNVIRQDPVGRSNEVVPKDTLDIESALKNFESFLNDYKQIHITKASDTLKYESLRKKLENAEDFAIRDFAPEELKHSVRVRYLNVFISLFEELYRINGECVKAGLKGGLNENELKTTQEMITLYKKKLWLETH